MNTTTLPKNEQTGELRDTKGLNFFEQDQNLTVLLKRYLSEEDFKRAQSLLAELGEVAGDQLDELSRISDKNPPELVLTMQEGNVLTE